MLSEISRSVQLGRYFMYAARQFYYYPRKQPLGSRRLDTQNKAFWEGTFIMVEEEAKVNTFSFDELVSIFSYLSPQNLSKCSQVCRDWHEASQVGSLWKRHCLQRWNFCHLGKLKPGRWPRRGYSRKFWIGVCREAP